MEKLMRLIFAVLASLPVVCVGGNIAPSQITLGFYKSIEKPIDEPLNYFLLAFDEGIEITSNARACITKDNEEVAVAASLEVLNYDYNNGTEGTLTLKFSGEYLPKGETYTLRIEPGSISLRDEKSVTNDAIEFPLSVPSDLGDAYIGYENGCRIVKSGGITCYWKFETKPVGNPEFEIYREGELVRKYPAQVDMDWDMGYAYLHFNEIIHFENDTKYRIKLPAGSASAAREDIVNKDVILDFVGAYPDNLERPVFTRCSLNDEVPTKADEISFHYDKPVKLIPGKPIILTEEFQTENKRWEALPTLPSDGEDKVVMVNFENVVFEEGKDYKIIIPESTIVNAKGDIMVNERQELRFTGTTGIDAAQCGDIRIEVCNGSISIGNVPDGIYLQIVSPDGRNVLTADPSGGNLDVEGLGRGIYIVKVGKYVRTILLK